MLLWSERLYISEPLLKKSEKIKKKLSQGRRVHDIFLITGPTNGENLFEVIESKELCFPYHKRREIPVYGLAKGKEDALELVRTIIEDMYRETGGLCSKEYFAKP